MRFSQFALLAFTALTATVIGQEFDPIQQLTMPGGRVRHAYDPFAAPQVSALPGVRGKANPGGAAKSPEVDWQSVTTASVRAHGAIASGVGARGAVTAHEPQVLRASDSGDFVAGELIVKLKDGVTVNSPGAARGVSTTNPALDAILQRAGSTQFEPVFKNPKRPARGARSVATGRPEPDLTRWYKLSGIDAATPMTSLTEELDSNPDVAWYEPNYIRRPAVNDLPTTVTDPKMADQWHLQATQVPEAWAYLKSKGLNPGGSPDVVVAVIDTGIDYNHPDLSANIWTNSGEIPANGIDDDNNGYTDDVHGINAVANTGNPIDDHGHGTHVAGIIAAQAGNNEGGVGVAYNSRVMSIKAARNSGILTVSDIVEGINYAVAQGVDVINMSYGGYSRSQLEEDTLAFASDYAVLVGAAGNDGKPNMSGCVGGADMFPAAYSVVLGVMAETETGELAPFSNFDCIPSDAHEYEVMAPGIDIVSTLPGGQYASWDGTSMAAPVVSGIAALVRSQYPDKDAYPASFISGQIASTSELNGLYKSVDANTAMTSSPKPRLEYAGHYIMDKPSLSPINDNDGIVDAGETVDVALVLRNHWGTAENVNVNVRAWDGVSAADDPYATIAIGDINYGTIDSFDYADNGIVTDAQGVITDITQPFRITLDPTTPNDYVLPLHITMTSENGLDTADTEMHIGTGSFDFVVQRGRELPQIIDVSTTLTKDYFWKVSQPTLVKSGVTLSMTSGTQVSFKSTIRVEEGARIVVQGAEENPVDFLENVYIQNNGVLDLLYARLHRASIQYDYSRPDTSELYVDHGLFYADGEQTLRIEPTTFNHSIVSGTAGDNIAYYLKDANVFLFSSKLHYYYLYNSLSTTYVDGTALLNGVFLSSFKTEFDVRGNQLSGNAFLPFYSYERPVLTIDSPNSVAGNYWGTTSTEQILSKVSGLTDEFGQQKLTFQPILDIPSSATFPFAYSVDISTESSANASQVGSEITTFTIKYNRDMDATISPYVTFGPEREGSGSGFNERIPEEHFMDFLIEPSTAFSNGWINPRTWQGTFTFTPTTTSGTHYLRIIGGRAADDHWLVCGDDQGRFSFEVVTAGIEAMQLQATGGAGKVDLAWTQDDFDLLAGYNLYRSNTPSGTYLRVNNTVIPPQTSAYSDTTVAPGQTFSYKFTIVKTDFTESNPSAIASATALDNVPPVVNHNPVVTSPPNQSRTIQATVTDNISVQAVTLFHRKDSSEAWQSRNMIKNTTNNSWSVNLVGSVMAQPGIYYYISATDGVNTSSAGTETSPFFIAIGENSAIIAWPWYY